MRNLRKVFLLNVVLVLEVFISPLYAATFDWLANPVDGNLNNSANWSPGGPPAALTDIGKFGGSTITNTFLSFPGQNIQQYTFGTIPYVINLNTVLLGFHGSGGVLTTSPTQQIFNLDSAQISLHDTSTLDLEGTGLVTCFLSDASIIFSDSSSAGAASLFLNNNSLISFEDFTSAGSASISLNASSTLAIGSSTFANSQINLENNSLLANESDLGNAVITADDSVCMLLSLGLGGNATVFLNSASQLSFSDSSDAQNMSITANNSSFVSFSNSSNGNNASLNLLTNSHMNTDHDTSLGSIASDSTGVVDLLLGAKLTVGGNNTSTTFAGVIQDGGTGGKFTKVGTGTLILSGVNTYTGLTHINLGELQINGQIAGNALVDLGALISGTGVIGGSLTVNGSIAPGNGIGTLNVVGPYVQNPGSTYLLQIDGAGNTDLINVLDTAELNGGELIAASLDGKVLTNHRYTILTAAGGVSGTFDGVSVFNMPTSLLLTPVVEYDTNNVYFVYKQKTFHFSALTPNQIAVAKQLESIVDPTPELLLILDTLQSLSPKEQQAALSQMSGEQYASLNLAAEITGRQFIRRLYDPIRSIVTRDPCKDYCSTCCYTGFRPCPAPTIALWFEAGAGQTFLNGNSNASGLTMNGYAATGGIQSSFNRNWTVGIAGSYVEDYIDYAIGNNGRNRMGFGALYALYRPTKFYVLGDLAFGGGQFKVKRSIDIGDLAYRTKGNPNHYQGLAYIEAGFDLNTSYFLVQPFLGFEGGCFVRNRISEKGGSPLNLNIHKESYGHIHSRLGVHMTSEEWSRVQLSVDLAWDCRLTATRGSIAENFQDFGKVFSITGVPRNRNSIDIAVTGLTKLDNGSELYLEAGGEFWSKASSYSVIGGIKYQW